LVETAWHFALPLLQYNGVIAFYLSLYEVSMEMVQTTLVTIQIPTTLYAQLRSLAETYHTNLAEIIETSIAQTYRLSPETPARQRGDEILIAAGLCRSQPLVLTTDNPLAPQQRATLAQRVGATGQPLSEIIIEEREQQ
jgi:hypothetical protein